MNSALGLFPEQIYSLFSPRCVVYFDVSNLADWINRYRNLQRSWLKGGFRCLNRSQVRITEVTRKTSDRIKGIRGIWTLILRTRITLFATWIAPQISTKQVSEYTHLWADLDMYFKCKKQSGPRFPMINPNILPLAGVVWLNRAKGLLDCTIDIRFWCEVRKCRMFGLEMERGRALFATSGSTEQTLVTKLIEHISHFTVYRSVPLSWYPGQILSVRPLQDGNNHEWETVCAQSLFVKFWADLLQIKHQRYMMMREPPL
jgi:hypothetical protein